MKPAAQLLAALVAALAAAPAASANETPSTFDVASAAGWPEALAICDVTRFLAKQPNLDADVILAVDDQTGWLRPLYGPRFTPPNLFYDSEIKTAFYRLERAGEANRKGFSEARTRYGQQMLRAFRRYTASDRRFLDQQSQVCGRLTEQVRARYP